MVHLTRKSDQTGRLPVDALREVFEWLALIDLPDRYWLGWVVATHVCIRWRRILLDMPRLWAAIVCVFETEESFAALIQRARNWPVDITVADPDLPPWMRTWALANLHRIEILGDCLGTLGMFKQAWAPAFHSRDLPALRELNLSLEWPLGWHSSRCYRPPAGATPMRAPSLRWLRLRLVQIHFYAPSLTHFRLHLYAQSGDGMLVSDLLAALKPCSMLEELDLVNAILADGPTRQLESCHLPHLRRISINPTSPDATFSFLCNITAPILQFLQWRFPLSYCVLDILSLQVVCQFIACPDFDTFRIRCERDHDTGRYFETCLGNYNALMTLFTDQYHHYPLAGRHNGLRLCMDEGRSVPSAVATVSDLSAQTIASTLRHNEDKIKYVHLSISHDFPSSSDTLRHWTASMARVLEPCFNVTVVEILVDDTDRFSTAHTLLNPEGSEFIFPRLTQLVLNLVRTTWYAGDRQALDAQTWLAHEHNGEHLVSFLAERKSAGMPLSSIEVTQEYRREDREVEVRLFRTEVLQAVGHLLL